MINNFEAFLLKETKEKSVILTITILGMIIPLPMFIRQFFMLLLIMNLAPLDIKTKKQELMLTLPFSKEELIAFSYILMSIIVMISTTLSMSWPKSNFNPLVLVECLIFSTAYFSLSVLLTKWGFDNVLAPLLIFLGEIGINIILKILNSDLVFIYKQFSPFFHENILIALITSTVIAGLTWYYLFLRGKRWK